MKGRTPRHCHILTTKGGAKERELTQSLSFALRFDGRRRIHSADELMAQITADRLAEYLEQAGYVVMCKPPADQHGASGNVLAPERRKTPLAHWDL